ncbi:hypothetical protein BDZ94DRAFT_523242 [Collybia nuda]|uniref:Transcription factor CBF/NF-Y/archaeal histone domain-containing protein n=1 Tax=Collybia nuda TaxID=64659 RepID=A0A9P5Y8K7_9AGAR|nr:hypothetical protein BDZ94DRAFT_523242 [Collybia nuda]
MASNSISTPLPGSSNETIHEIYSDVEEEFDELDSDSEIDEQGASTSTRKNGVGPTGGERIPGHSLLPALRLENIIQADGVTGALSLSKEGLFVLSIATEEFIKRMTQAGQLHASADRRNTVHYRDMAATTQQYQEFKFLNDTIPAPLTLSEALSLREAKEKELLEEDPAMATSASLHPTTSVSAPTARTKAKVRSNGAEKLNGTLSLGPRKRSGSRGRTSHDDASEGVVDVDGDGVWSEWAERQAISRSGSELPHRASRNGAGSLSAVARPSPLANGHSVVPSRSGTNTPRSQEGASEQPSPQPYVSRSSEEATSWPGQYTGPASGFLQGPGGPFGRVTQNPGRTIYSQQHRAD